MFVPTFEVCPEFKDGTVTFVVNEAESVSFGQTAWEYLQLGGLVEGRLPDADEVVDLAEKAGIEVSRTEINRLLALRYRGPRSTACWRGSWQSRSRSAASNIT